MGEYVSQFIGDYIIQIAVAVVAVTCATAAWITTRGRRYVKSAEFDHGIDALRLEFRRSIDEARAATTRKATSVGDKLYSVIKPIGSNVTELNVRLARLEEHADSVEAFMAGSQKNGLQESEQIAAHLRKLEQRLAALNDSIDKEWNHAIEARLTKTEKRIGDLFQRLELGEKARADLGGLISLFVKQLKRIDISSVGTAARVAELESLRSKVAGLEQRFSSTVDPEGHGSAENLTTNHHVDVGHSSPNQGEEPATIETNGGSAKGKPTSTEEPLMESPPNVLRPSENSSAIEANGRAPSL